MTFGRLSPDRPSSGSDRPAADGHRPSPDSHSWSEVVSVDTAQLLDIYEDEIADGLKLFRKMGVQELRERQKAAVVQSLNDRHVFLGLATGAGKSLCFQLPAVIRSQRMQHTTVVMQPTLNLIANQIRTLRDCDISVEALSSLNSAEERGNLVQRVEQGYRPAFIYTTVDSFFGFYSNIFRVLLKQRALARFVLDEGHTNIHWAEFKESMVSLHPRR